MSVCMPVSKVLQDAFWRKLELALKKTISAKTHSIHCNEITCSFDPKLFAKCSVCVRVCVCVSPTMGKKECLSLLPWILGMV